MAAEEEVDARFWEKPEQNEDDEPAIGCPGLVWFKPQGERTPRTAKEGA